MRVRLLCATVVITQTVNLRCRVIETQVHAHLCKGLTVHAMVLNQSTDIDMLHMTEILIRRVKLEISESGRVRWEDSLAEAQVGGRVEWQARRGSRAVDARRATRRGPSAGCRIRSQIRWCEYDRKGPDGGVVGRVRLGR